MSALQRLANRVAANRYREGERLTAIARAAGSLVDVVATDPVTGLATVRDAAGGVRQVYGIEAPVGAVTRLPGALFLG